MDVREDEKLPKGRRGDGKGLLWQENFENRRENEVKRSRNVQERLKDYGREKDEKKDDLLRI